MNSETHVDILKATCSANIAVMQAIIESVAIPNTPQIVRLREALITANESIMQANDLISDALPEECRTEGQLSVKTATALQELEISVAKLANLFIH